MVTKQELANAKIDAKDLGDAINEKKTVTPRYGTPFKTVPLVIEELNTKANEVIAQGFYKGFATEALLLAAKPTVAEMRARADDTRKIWRWNRTSGEGVVPVTGTWTDTGLSDVDQAKDFANANPLFKSKSLSNTDDLNNILVAGYYTAFGGGNTPTLEKNYPTTRPGILQMYTIATGSTGTVGFQWYQSDLGVIYWRNTNTVGNAWNAWQQILKKSDLDSTAMVKTIADSTDINTLTVRGQYDITHAKASTFLNLPPQMIEQENANGGGTLTVIKNPNTYITHQYFDGYAEFGSYFRSMLGTGGWTPWQQLGRKVTKYNNKDLNNLLTVGIHTCGTSASDIVSHHYPINDQLFLEVVSLGNVYRQVAYQRANNTIWTRSHWGSNGWQPWVKIITQTDLDALKAELENRPASTELSEIIKADLANPFKPTRFKLIGDSITWGMGGSAGSPIEPRFGTLEDVRNTIDTSVSKTWANLLMAWIGKVYGDGTMTADVAGSGYTSCPIYTHWTEIYKTVKMVNKEGAVLTDALKLSYITQTIGLNFNGSSINMVGQNYPSLRPTELEITLESDHLYFCYSKHAVGDANDLIEVYLDGALHSSFSYYDTVTDINAQYKLTFPMGTHTVRFKNVSTSVSSYATVWGFRVDKKIFLQNDGIIGSSTKSWIDRGLFEGSLSSGKDDLILFMLGTNDRGTVGGQEGYIKRLDECLTKMKNLAPSSNIVMMCSTFASNENTTTYKFNMRDVNAMMRKFSNEKGLKFISQYEYCAQNLLDANAIWSDGLHLNDHGNRLYFENIIKNLFAI